MVYDELAVYNIKCMIVCEYGYQRRRVWW